MKENKGHREKEQPQKKEGKRKGGKEPPLPFTPSRRTTHPTPAHTTLAGLQTGIPPPATVATGLTSYVGTRKGR